MSILDARFHTQRGNFTLDIAFQIPGIGLTALFGPSGCGKTTVLRCIAGLERTYQGRLTVQDHVWQDETTFLAPHLRRVGYVFQEASLFPHLSAKDNLLFGYKRAGSSAGGPGIDEVIDLLGLAPLLARGTQSLSGGERQRVAMGRALLSSPEILLMDEPMAALDKFSKDDILPYIARLHEHLSIPVLYVTHDLAEVERLADRMILMDAGSVRADGPLSSLLVDPNLPFARLPEAGVALTGQVVTVDDAYGLSTLRVAGGDLIVPCTGAPIGSTRRVRITASDVGLCRSRTAEGSSIMNAPIARITAAESFTEHQMTVFLRLGEAGDGARLLARITRKSWDTLALNVGETVHALIKSVAVADPNRS